VSLPLPSTLVFFLGGQDLEMAEIRALLERESPGRFHDRGLRWGARVSAYRTEIEAALNRGLTPVLVELPDDIGLPPERVLTVEHHGATAGAEAPTSLEQVFNLLGLDPSRWTRWMSLVAANDRGYIPGLLSTGASREEIVKVRAADRAAQGITAAEEAEAARAAGEVERRRQVKLTVARMSHSRLAALEDRLHSALGGPGVENLVVIGGGEVNFSGDGQVVLELARRFPRSWSGGNLPEQGFWGMTGETEDLVPIIDALLESRSRP
jgi:hypothetical protein